MRILLNNFRYAALALALAAGVAACVEEAPEYSRSQPETNAAVYFPDNLVSSFDLEANKGVIPVKFLRSNTESDITVALEVTADSLFSVPSSVNFAAGEESATINVTYKVEDAEESVSYSVSIVINEEDASIYGTTSYSFTASVPSQWSYFLNPVTGQPAVIHWTQDFWGEEVDSYLKYQLTDDGYYYMQTECIPATHYYNGYYTGYGFFGTSEAEGENELTFMLYAGESDLNGYEPIEMYPTWVYTNTNYNCDVYTYDYFHYWTDLRDYSFDFLDFVARYSGNYPLGYYDGNGGFYFYVQTYYMPDYGGGWTAGYYDIVGISDGFVRTTDYNDDSHVGASSVLYLADVASMFFSEDGQTPTEWTEQSLRYDASYLDSVVDSLGVPAGTTTTYYLASYFGENVLAFTGPAPEILAEGDALSAGDNEQSTGLYIFGNEVYVDIKNGSVSFAEDSEYPTFTLNVKVYAKDGEGTLTYDFGTVTEIISVTGEESTFYTMDDAYGGLLEDYLGTWTVTGTSNDEVYEYDIIISDADSTNASGNPVVNIRNLSRYDSAITGGDIVKAEYYNYGLRVYGQTLEGTFRDYGLSVYPYDPYSGYYYTGSSIFIMGYICSDGNLAFVNPYSDVNITGFYYDMDLDGYYFTSVYEVSGYKSASEETAVTGRKPIDRKPVSAKASGSGAAARSFAPSAGGVKVTPEILGSAARPPFSLKPIERQGKDFGEAQRLQTR